MVEPFGLSTCLVVIGFGQVASQSQVSAYSIEERGCELRPGISKYLARCVVHVHQNGPDKDLKRRKRS